MPQTTPAMSLPLIAPAQAQKHVTHNEALALLDATVQLSVESRDATSPPGATKGARFIVGTGASGDWAGEDGNIALWTGSDWRFFVPAPGWRAWVVAEATLVARHLGGWIVAAISETDLQDLDRLGIRTAPDATNRLAVSSNASLFTHDGSGHRVKVNKSATPDTASLLFQTGFSGRAEMGTTGSDDFAVKVSADGTSWSEGLRIDATNGHVGIGKTPGAVPLDVAGGMMRLTPIAQVDLPTASAAGEGALAYVTEVGEMIFSDGTDWRKCRNYGLI